MKRHYLPMTGLLFVMAMSMWMMSSAQSASTVSPEVVERIKARCTENLATLNRLHQTDAFLRNDRGNLYRTIADKLMVPMNRRIADNQLDGAALLTVTSDYNKEYSTFSRAYIEYDNSLSDVLKINCKREPVSFYNALTEARDKREELFESNQRLRGYITEYAEAFGGFRAEFNEEQS